MKHVWDNEKEDAFLQVNKKRPDLFVKVNYLKDHGCYFLIDVYETFSDRIILECWQESDIAGDGDTCLVNICVRGWDELPYAIEYIINKGHTKFMRSQRNKREM